MGGGSDSISYGSVRETEWIESMKTFGISTEEDKRIIRRLGLTLLTEHEKMFGNYWSQVYGPPSILTHLLGKDLSGGPGVFVREKLA